MTQNMQDYSGVRALAAELDVECTLDPTITPMMDGNRSTLGLGVDQNTLRQVFRDASLVGDVDEFCAIPAQSGESELESTPCSAGHTACYVSPYGEVFPCVQFPLPTGNVRQQRFVDIWRDSDQMNEVRSIRLNDLTTCPSCTHVGSCTRCPGPRLHGRKHARAVVAGLREILRQNRHSLGQYAGQETGRGKSAGTIWCRFERFRIWRAPLRDSDSRPLL